LFLKSPFGISVLTLLAAFPLSLPAHSQSFSVDTNVSQSTSLYSYAFTLNYDQAGAVQSLTDNIWDWSFDIDPSLPTPMDITTPTGWLSSYDATSGQFDFYTEGPNGAGNGDFGNYVILPGQSLSGFGLTTPAAPDSSIAFATDVQYNQDATLAILPTTVPAAVPEVSTFASFGALLFLGGAGVVARRRMRRRVSLDKPLP